MRRGRHQSTIATSRLRSLRRRAVAAVTLAVLVFGPGRAFVQPAQAATFVLRINAGGPSAVDSVGQTWMGDRYYLAGGGVNGTGQDIAGTYDDAVFQTNRWGMGGYDIPLPRKATYRVRLLFAEAVFTSPGERVFDVSAEGRLVADDLDVVARVGAGAAYVQTFDVTTKDRTLNLRFAAVADDPMISGIEVMEGTATTTTTTVAPTTTTTAPGSTTTTTAPSTSTTVAPSPTTTIAPTTTTVAPAPTTTTTVAPAPTTTTTIAPAPSTGFPGPTNTGVPAGTALRSSGSITTSYDGQVIDALDISGSIQVEHNNVTIKRTRIRFPGGQAVTMNPNKVNLVIQDCEMDGTGNGTPDAVVGDNHFTIRRCNIHHFGEGPRINGDNVIEDNWIHDFLDFRYMDAHQDTLQTTGGSNITIRHNTMDMNIDAGNAVIMVSTDVGSNLTIENNLIAGGGYSVYGGDVGGSVPAPGWSNVRIVNNRFSTKFFPKCGYHGPLTAASNAYTSGNVFHESGLPI